MIQKLLNDIILEEDKKKREETLGKGITSWRSSGLGTCMRGRYLDRLLSGTGIKPEHDPRTLRVFEIGNQVEDWLMNSLKKQNQYQLYQQVELEDSEYNLTGHLDGYLVENPTEKIVEGGDLAKETIVECKSKNSKAFWYMDKKGEGAQVHHKMQLHTYLYMMNKHGGKLPDGTVIPPRSGKLTEGRILYVSKDDMAMLEYPVYLNDTELEKMWKYELDTLNRCWKDRTAPPAPEKGSWQEKYCKFCEAGLCETLDDEMVKGLWEDKEKELETTSSTISVTTLSGTSTTSLTESMIMSAVSTLASGSLPPKKKKRTVYKFKKGDNVMNVIGTRGMIHERIDATHYGVAWEGTYGLVVEHEDNLIKSPF
jgi:hypothetical protein